MGLRGYMFLALIVITLLVECNGQVSDLFNVTATVQGDTITVNIVYDPSTITTATFQCQLDGVGDFENCTDGIQYTSVSVGTHNVTVIGEINGNPVGPEVISPLEVQEDLMVDILTNQQGTGFTLTISANQPANFECRLDDEPNFVQCMSGYERSGLSAGQHTVFVRATSTVTPTLQTTVSDTFNVSLLAITIDNIVANQNLEAGSIEFQFDASEDFPTQCSIDGGAFVDCASPYVVNTSTLTTGSHSITIRTVIRGVVRGTATQSFDVLEVVIIELKDTTYSVVEDDRIFNITVVKQGDPGRAIVVRIVASDNTTDTFDDVVQSQTVTFSPGQDIDEMTVQFSVASDGDLERNETFFINLELIGASNGGQLGARSSAVGTIINDDRGEVAFVVGDRFINEQSGTVNFIFALSGAAPEPGEEIEVIAETFELVPSDAEAGVDYQSNTITTTFDDIINDDVLAVTIVNDDITERTESFGIRLILPEATQQLGVSLGDDSEVIIGILDNDEGDLVITCYTRYLENGSILLFFEANQEADFSCALNNNGLVACSSPQLFNNVEFSDTVTVRAETTLRSDPQIRNCTRTVLIIEGGLQVIGTGSISVPIRSTKNATYMCRLNDEDPVECVDGQVFDNLAAGTYTVTIEATGVENTQEFAIDTVGPIVIAGAGVSNAEAIAACFGSEMLGCDTNGLNCQFTAMWRTRGDRVTFRLQAAFQGWVAVGFSLDNIMPNTDIIAGAADDSDFFVDDRYATATRVQPPRDAIQNVGDPSASLVDGNTIVEFSRDKITNDPNDDITLDVCRFVLFAWGTDVNVAAREIRYHGPNRTDSPNTLQCFPSEILCPERFDCGDPGAPVNGGRTFTNGTLEGSVVTYTCDTGFTLVGNTTTQTCVLETNGTFWRNGTRPTCTMNACSDPGRPENGNTIGDDTSVGAVVNHTCNIGYVLNGASERECLSSGNWSDPLPTCDEIICDDPGRPVNGNTMGTLVRAPPSDVLALDTTLGAIVNHTCDEGFVLQGAMERECLSTREWSDPLPTCIPDCGDPGVPENGDTMVTDTTVGEIANHTCNDGFVLRGAIQRECLPNGEWSEPLPMCVVDCGDPGTPVNGNTMGTMVGATLNTTLGAVVNHSCIEGYTLQGAVERVCLPSGNWSEPLPICNETVCEDPGMPENGATSGTAVTVGSVVNHTCDVGFILNGANQRECLSNGTWSRPLPICLRNITRFGGPVFKVPIHIDQTLIDENPDLAEACLCYEVQGSDNTTFNLLSDTCVSVNALYQAMADPTAGNVVSHIGITAIDQDGMCRRIEASLEGCTATVDETTPVEIGTPFINAGISVIRYENRVRISVPNCGIGKHELVIWFICKTLEDGQPVSEFVIAKGVNLRPTSHGLIGQFWNIPVGVNDYEFGDPSVPYYVVDVNPFNAASRTFIGLLNDLPEHVSPLYCLQVGDSQGGATDRFTDPNDSVVQGSYADYEVADLFSTDFVFSRFGSVCTK